MNRMIKMIITQSIPVLKLSSSSYVVFRFVIRTGWSHASKSIYFFFADCSPDQSAHYTISVMTFLKDSTER